MKIRLKNIIVLSVVLAQMIFGQNCLAQNSIELYSDTLFGQLKDYDSISIIRRVNPENIEWFHIDTFTVKYYNSAIRGNGPELDTLTIYLRLENGWDSLRIKETKIRNAELISELSNIYHEYMDSIDWRGYKITKSSFEGNIVMHLKMKYPVQFTKEQELMIDQIFRCPDFVHNDIGVFLDCNNPGIKEDDVRRLYHAKLEYISITIFGLNKVNYGKSIYQ